MCGPPPGGRIVLSLPSLWGGDRRARGVYRKIAPNLLRPLDSVPWDRWSFHAGKSVRIAPVVGHFFPNRGEAAVWEKVVRRRSDSNTRRRHLRLDPYRPDPSRPARSIPRWETSLPPKRLISRISHVFGCNFSVFLRFWAVYLGHTDLHTSESFSGSSRWYIPIGPQWVPVQTVEPAESLCGVGFT